MKNWWKMKHCGKSQTQVWFFSSTIFGLLLINVTHFLPFWTLSQSRKISSPPFTLPLFLLTRQMRSSAVFGAPAEQEVSSYVKRSWCYSGHNSAQDHEIKYKHKLLFDLEFLSQSLAVFYSEAIMTKPYSIKTATLRMENSEGNPFVMGQIYYYIIF